MSENMTTMRPIPPLLFAAALMVPSAALAAPEAAKPLPAEVRLSDEEKEKVLEAAAEKNREPVAPAIEEIADEELARPIQGEVGLSLGTGGYRSAYGTAVVPLEGDGVAIISLGTTDLGRRRYYVPWWE